MTPFIVGFRGLIGAGKTAICREIHAATQTAFGIRTCLHSMAGPLKDGFSAMGITKESTPDLYRRGLQYVGTDLVRASAPDHWVNLFKQWVADQMWGENDVVLVDDIRFPNEQDACDLTIFLVRVGDCGAPIEPAAGSMDHESERWNYQEWCSLQNIPNKLRILNAEGKQCECAMACLSIIHEAMKEQRCQSSASR